MMLWEVGGVLFRKLISSRITIYFWMNCQELKSDVDKNLIWNLEMWRWKDGEEYFIFSLWCEEVLRTIFFHFILSWANKTILNPA